MPRTRSLLLAAALAATATATTATTATAAAPAGARPGGHVVPGLTGAAALRAGAVESEHFRQIHQIRDQRATPAASTLHADWGMFPTSTAPVGAMATQSIDPNVKLTDAGDETLYTPTMLPSKSSCIELSTIYVPGAVEVGAWDWCASTLGFLKLTVADAAFMSTYTTTVHHLKAYTARVIRTDAASNTWTAQLYNQQTQAWDTFYTSSGPTKLSTTYYGWDVWEIYSNANPTTGNGYYCVDARGVTFESSNLQYTFDGTDWTAATPDNSHPVGPGGSYNCPSLVFQTATANSDFLTTVPKPAPAWPTVQNGNTGNRVKTVQYLLNARANAGLTVDGAFGAKTLAAVKSFQSAHGLSVDGIVGANTWKALVTTLQLGASGDAVRAVQNELTAHGVSTTVSGSYDATTADHVQQFQVTSGIAPSAKADTTTWQFLVQ